ncbi:MAG: sugar phosphate isomerase/epimerase family protein [bacterium]
MRFGCCVSPKPDLVANMKVAEDAGCDFVELTVGTVDPEGPEDGFLELKGRLSAFKVKPEAFNVFIPGELKLVGNEVDFPRISRYVDSALKRVAELGGRVVVFGSGGARRVPEGFPFDRARDQLVRFLDMVADVARREGITIAIEPLYRKASNIVNSVPEALDLAKAVNRQEIRVLADLFHVSEENEPLLHVAEAGRYLAHVHIPVPEVPELASEGKPFDHEGFFRALRDAGYDGRISVEDNGRRFTDFAREAPAVLRFLRRRWG